MFSLTFKPALFERPAWGTQRRTIPLEDLPSWFGALEPYAFNMGAVGLYVMPRLSDSPNHGCYWPMLDIEDKGHHFEINYNLDAVRSTLDWLTDQGLDAGLHIILSGHGCRFVWPFMIPHEFVGAFREVVRDIPNSEAVKDRGFMRLFAYRGHHKQNKSPQPDIHTHKLDDRSALYSLDEDGYKRFVAGHIDHAKATGWLNDLMPVKPMPPAWKTILTEYQRIEKFKNCAVQFPKRSANKNYAEILRQATTAMDEIGISYHEKQVQDSVIYKLDRCPECSRRGIAFFTGSGRLKCHSTSCAAGERGPDGSSIGLPPEEWIPGYEAPDVETDESIDDELSSIDQARELVKKAIQSQKNVVVEVTAGAGKTGTTLRAILPECKNKKILFCVPTNLKAAEVMAEIAALPKELTAGININRIRGRYSEKDESGDIVQNCEQVSLCSEIVERGYSPGMLICPDCVFSSSCGYNAQFEVLKHPGLIVTTHAQALFIKIKKLDAIICDEDPLRTILRQESISAGAIKWFEIHTYEACRNVFQKINDTTDKAYLKLKAAGKSGWLYVGLKPDGSETFEHPELFDLGDFIQAEKNEMLSFLGVYQKLFDEKEIAYQKRLYKENINKRALDWLLIAFGEISGSAVVKIDTGSNFEPYSFAYRMMPDIRPKGRIVILDATAYPAAMNKLFNREFDTIKATCDLPDCKTVHIKRGAGITKAQKFSDGTIRKLLSEAVDELPPTASSLMICTWKAIEERVRKLALEIRPDLKIDVIHFGATRGLNEYENHNAGMLFGTYTANPSETDITAKILFGDGPESLPDRDAFRNHLSNAENIQAIHRVRPVNGNKTLIVIGKDWIPGLPAPHMVKDMRPGQKEAFDEAFDRALRFFEAYGFLTQPIVWMLGIRSAFENKKSEAGSAGHWFELGQKNPKVCKKLSLCLIYNTLLDTETRNCKVLVLGQKNYYQNLLHRIRRNHPTASNLFTTQTSTGKEIHGLGTVTAARIFFISIGNGEKFDSSKWRDVPQFQTGKCYEHISQILFPHSETAQTIFVRSKRTGNFKPWHQYPDGNGGMFWSGEPWRPFQETEKRYDYRLAG